MVLKQDETYVMTWLILPHVQEHVVVCCFNFVNCFIYHSSQLYCELKSENYLPICHHQIHSSDPDVVLGHPEPPREHWHCHSPTPLNQCLH